MVLWILPPFRFLSRTGFHPLWPRHPPVLACFLRSEPRNARTLVWALFRSLAATWNRNFLFLPPALDVSVHRVPFRMFDDRYTVTKSAGFPHSDICGSMRYLLLTTAFRNLSFSCSFSASALCAEIASLSFSAYPADVFCFPHLVIYLSFHDLNF